MQTLLLIPLISVFPSNPKGRASKPRGVAESHMQTGKCTHTYTCSLPILQCQILVGGRLLSLIDQLDFGAQGLSG